MSTYLSSSTPTLLSGARIVARRRAALQLSISELAKQCQMPVADLEMLELGRFVPSPSQAFVLASTLGIRQDRFCNWALAQTFLHPEFLLDYAQGEGKAAQA